jgi:ABC-type Fe3+/spermidine/putrescine transport system ATPase subunit
MRVTTIYVTHDQNEAMAMSDRIAVLNRGKIHQIGIPEDIYERPATKFVADFIGRNNVLEAVIRNLSDHTIVVQFANGAELRIDAHRHAAGTSLSPGARVGVCVRAESVRVDSEDAILTGVVMDVEYAGPVCTCTVKTELGPLQIEVPSSQPRPTAGQEIRLSIAPTAVHLVAWS